MGQVIDRAAREWFSRPEDERFSSIEELQARVAADRAASMELRPVARQAVRVEPDGEELTWQGYRLTHWSASQLCQRAGAPHGYLKRKPAELAARCLNHDLADLADDSAGPLVPYVRERDGDRVLRAMTGQVYRRIFNERLVEGIRRVMERPGSTWSLVPDWNQRPSGLFYGDRSMFCILVDDASRSIVTHPEATQREELGRFFMICNSEEGASSFYFCCGWFRFICGNLMVWDATGVREVRLRHVGQIGPRLQKAFREGLGWAADPAIADQSRDAVRLSLVDKLPGAESIPPVDTKLPELLAPVYVRATGGKLPAATAREAVRAALEQHLDPRTRWGAANGVTWVGRDRKHQDSTADLARLGGLLMPRTNRRALPAMVV